MRNELHINFPHMIEQDARIKQEKLHLVQTKLCADTVNLAREKGWDPSVVAECFKLMEAMAVSDWGDGTTIDDFSDEHNFIVFNGKKKELIPKWTQETTK